MWHGHCGLYSEINYLQLNFFLGRALRAGLFWRSRSLYLSFFLFGHPPKEALGGATLRSSLFVRPSLPVGLPIPPKKLWGHRACFASLMQEASKPEGWMYAPDTCTYWITPLLVFQGLYNDHNIPYTQSPPS